MTLEFEYLSIKSIFGVASDSPMKKNFGNRLFSFNRFLVRNTWKYVSNLGTGYTERLSEIKSDTLVNQINFVLAGTMAVIFVILVIRLSVKGEPLTIGTMRVLYTFVLCIINLILAQLSFRKLSRFSLIFISPVLFVIVPTILGFVEDEGYFYNSYILVAASIMPQLVLSPGKDKKMYWGAMLYYLVLIISIDFLAIYFQQEESDVLDHFVEYAFLIKLAQVFIFLFINTSIYYLRRLNLRFEERLKVKNQVLNVQNGRIKANREKIRQQKETIEESSRAVADSINYAAMIQKAVLQPEDFMNEWDLHNFILYKPKAKVSGDFYWGTRRGNIITVVAADCTGHGVPGAFMSMLGMAFLDDIDNNNKILTPAETLNFLRELIINKLTRKGNQHELKDGMDISICSIDREAGRLEFAGANNPLYLVRDGKLTRVPADKMPIGIYSTSAVPFTNNVIELRKDDALYLFSDGYADQFGGKNGRKMMYRSFQELLVKHSLKPMELQKTIIDNHFEKWKGEFEQVDDVLVLGIRV